MPENAENALMKDRELCELLQISRSTLMRHLQDGPPNRPSGAAGGDIRTIQRVNVGIERRWVRKAVDEFIFGAAKS